MTNNAILNPTPGLHLLTTSHNTPPKSKDSIGKVFTFARSAGFETSSSDDAFRWQNRTYDLCIPDNIKLLDSDCRDSNTPMLLYIPQGVNYAAYKANEYNPLPCEAVYAANAYIGGDSVAVYSRQGAVVKGEAVYIDSLPSPKTAGMGRDIDSLVSNAYEAVARILGENEQLKQFLPVFIKRLREEKKCNNRSLSELTILLAIKLWSINTGSLKHYEKNGKRNEYVAKALAGLRSRGGVKTVSYLTGKFNKGQFNLNDQGINLLTDGSPTLSKKEGDEPTRARLGPQASPKPTPQNKRTGLQKIPQGIRPWFSNLPEAESHMLAETTSLLAVAYESGFATEAGKLYQRVYFHIAKTGKWSNTVPPEWKKDALSLLSKALGEKIPEELVEWLRDVAPRQMDLLEPQPMAKATIPESPPKSEGMCLNERRVRKLEERVARLDCGQETSSRTNATGRPFQTGIRSKRDDTGHGTMVPRQRHGSPRMRKRNQKERGAAMPVSWLRQVDLSELPEFADLIPDELARLKRLIAWLAKLQDCINGRKVRW